MAEQTEKLSAAQRSKIRRLSQPKELAPDEEGGELNIVPFLDIITNVLMFVLASVAVTFTATLDVNPPKRGGGGGRPPTAPALNLSVLITGDGFAMKASGGSLAPGCTSVGSGVTVPKVNGDYDYNGLNACAKNLKINAEAAKDEDSFTVSANPNIPYQVIISTIDAMRTDSGGGDLFPTVNFGLVR